MSARIYSRPHSCHVAQCKRGRSYYGPRCSAAHVEFKNTEYVWHPEISPAGPVVNIFFRDRVMYVYRNRVRIGVSTVSTGTKSHATPTGIFTILQKKVTHEFNIYKGAKMPHMQRLTWTGIAIHAGHLPGYPASHGCVRLPVDSLQNSIPSRPTVRAWSLPTTSLPRRQKQQKKRLEDSVIGPSFGP
jgi:L,D-transpeptidase catalytic domain